MSSRPPLVGDSDGNIRLVIWGNSGAGKTSLAYRLGRVLPGCKVIDMDTLLWNDNWVKTPPEELEATLHRLTTTHSSWIIDGNYLKRKEAFLSRATDIVWLDFPLYVTLWRLLKRTFARWRSQKPLFGTTNCREKLRLTFFSRESIIWWCISQHRPLKKGLEEMLRKDMDGVKAKLRRRFTATEEVDDWVGAVEQLVKEQ